MNTVLAAWPIIKWALQALGFLGPEDREAERAYQLKLLAAQEENRRALTEAFQRFQEGWRPSAEYVYGWANTILALFQPALLALVYYDVIWGDGRSVQAARDLEAAGIPGLLIMAIMLFPFYGPALVQGVQNTFGAAVDLAVRRRNGALGPSAAPGGRPAGWPDIQPGPAPASPVAGHSAPGAGVPADRPWIAPERHGEAPEARVTPDDPDDRGGVER